MDQDVPKLGVTADTQRQLKVCQGSASALMHERRGHFDVIDLDPCGAVAEYLPSALASLADGGMPEHKFEFQQRTVTQRTPDFSEDLVLSQLPESDRVEAGQGAVPGSRAGPSVIYDDVDDADVPSTDAFPHADTLMHDDT